MRSCKLKQTGRKQTSFLLRISASKAKDERPLCVVQCPQRVLETSVLNVCVTDCNKTITWIHGRRLALAPSYNKTRGPLRTIDFWRLHTQNNDGHQMQWRMRLCEQQDDNRTNWRPSGPLSRIAISYSFALAVLIVEMLTAPMATILYTPVILVTAGCSAITCAVSVSPAEKSASLSSSSSSSSTVASHTL